MKTINFKAKEFAEVREESIVELNGLSESECNALEQIMFSADPVRLFNIETDKGLISFEGAISGASGDGEKFTASVCVLSIHATI